MILSLSSVTFAYPGGPEVLRKAELDIPEGAYALVRGPSGAGKSTLLRLFCRLEEPLSGIVRFHGTDVRDMAPADLRRRVAYVQQTPTLVDGSVRDNLLLPFSFRANAGLVPPTDAELAEQLAGFLLDMPPDRNARELSVGQAQRVCLIRSLLLHPEILLMDEPTSALDARSADVVLDMAQQLHERGKTIVMISHSEAAPPGTSMVLHLENGRVTA
ncbi:ABC transporter ATP-binding protein [Pseudodesulfovibrio tunisiensis]|uniref:ABC transporter ATP-binding protein n=1 Tax=Pseudodesulfovibrio tunisiensis TaxID=463192 RepID=UPI001FB3C9E3|nr:ABC transporter ATP-binding protein [Pseudodesulfovibrio tunisiensis]